MKYFHLDNNCYLKYQKNSLVVQWLELHVFTAEGLGLIPVWGTNIPQASRHRQKKRKFFKVQIFGLELNMSRDPNIRNPQDRGPRAFKVQTLASSADI